MSSIRFHQIVLVTVLLTFTASAADVLFYGWGKGKNFNQTGTSTTVVDSTNPWEVTSFVWLNPTGALTAAYFGTTANPTLYPLNNNGSYFEVSYSATSQAAIDSQVPNGTYRITIQTVHDGNKVADLALSGNTYPNTPIATNYMAMQAVNPAVDFTVYWNAFTGGTTNDVILATLADSQLTPITNSPYPGMSGTLNGTNRSWIIPHTALTPNSTNYVRLVFYKVVSTNKTAYAGVTGYAVYGTGTTIPLITTNPPTPPSPPTANAATAVVTNSFTANWSNSATATGYRLDVSTNVSFANFVAGFQDLDVGNVLSKIVSGLSAGTTYYYRLRAYNTGGASGNSGTITVMTTPNPPAAPIATAATSVTSNSFNANWSSAIGATGYRLDVSTNSGFATYLSGYQNLDVGNVTTRLVSGLSGNSAYYYRLRAYNTGGTSGNSGTITVTTAPAFIPALGYAKSGSNFVISWPTNDPAFKLEYATNLPAGIWVSNPVSPTVVTGQYTITTGMTNSARFYRLKK